MNTALSTELYWLIMTIFMTALLWIPYILNRMQEQGIASAIWDRFGYTSTNRDWARRMMQAHENATENLVLFAPLVILVQLSGVQSKITAMACMVYFFARLTHYVVFTFAIPVLRVVSFLTGFAMQMILLTELLKRL